MNISHESSLRQRNHHPSSITTDQHLNSSTSHGHSTLSTSSSSSSIDPTFSPSSPNGSKLSPPLIDSNRPPKSPKLNRSPLQLPNLLPSLTERLPDLKKIELSGVKVRVAPLKVPGYRRMQTACVAILALALPSSFAMFLFLCSIPLFWPIVGPYLIWILYLDQAPKKGGRPSLWFRRLPFWRHFAAYYPVSLIKEADLPADRPYIFGYHPHGIIGIGAFTNFATDATNFSQVFPGIQPHLLTLSLNFHTPFYRDVLLALGVCSVSKRSCVNILRNGPGSAITIVVGGAAESLAAHPGTNDLTLRKRLGFIKIAVREGADLVPVFSFGENDTYDQLANQRGTLVFKFQKKVQKLFGFTLPLFHGRGIFNYNLGLLPFRQPVITVVGRPIHVKQNDNPSTAELEEIQKRYIDELMRIWHSYKDVYARDRKRELRLVE